MAPRSPDVWCKAAVVEIGQASPFNPRSQHGFDLPHQHLILWQSEREGFAATFHPTGAPDAAKGIEDQIELRLNNALLDRPTADQGWLVFKAQPGQFAVGNNLIGLRVSERPPDAQGEILVEKLEVHVAYR